MIWQLEFLLFPLIILMAIIALEVKDLLVAAVMLSVFSFASALLYTTMGALDVGLTEAVVGAGVSGVLFLIALLHTKQKAED